MVTPNGIVEAAYNARPNTKYVLWEVTNLTAYVTHMGHMLLGANDGKERQYAAHGMRKAYDNNLCITAKPITKKS